MHIGVEDERVGVNDENTICIKFSNVRGCRIKKNKKVGMK